jgi:3-hydroxybutyryl-CoA dehydrogenase
MKISTVCVCGAGTMGSGIAQVAAAAGFTTIQYDVSPEMLEKSKAGIEKNMQFLVTKGKLNELDAKAILSRIQFTSSAEDCKADLIIEAIIESKQAKIDLFKSLTAFNSAQTIFATNTSSIFVGEIASAIEHPERVIGMHFFNPAPLMKLVEVIKTEFTSKEIIETVFNTAKSFGKTPVLCNDVPGFIVNRVARHYYLEAMKLVETKQCDIADIDALMETNGFKMGPFKLMDLIGMDINFSVSNIVWEALGKPERLTPSIIQKQKVESGKLGKKTGEGFYKY